MSPLQIRSLKTFLISYRFLEGASTFHCCPIKILLGWVAPHLQVNPILLNQPLHIFPSEQREKPLGGQYSVLTVTGAGVLCFVDFLQCPVLFLLVMPKCLSDESEKTKIENSEEKYIGYELKFPAVSVDGLSLGNDGVVKAARATEEVNGEPVNVVLGLLRGNQVGDELCECRNCPINRVARRWLRPLCLDTYTFHWVSVTCAFGWYPAHISSWRMLPSPAHVSRRP